MILLRRRLMRSKRFLEQPDHPRLDRIVFYGVELARVRSQVEELCLEHIRGATHAGGRDAHHGTALGESERWVPLHVGEFSDRERVAQVTRHQGVLIERRVALDRAAHVHVTPIGDIDVGSEHPMDRGIADAGVFLDGGA